MEILEGLYRSNYPSYGEDNFGGNVFKVYSYNYFFFKGSKAWSFNSVKGKTTSINDTIVEFDDALTLLNIVECLKKGRNGKIINWQSDKINFFIDEFFWGEVKYEGVVVDNIIAISGVRDNSKDTRFSSFIPSEDYRFIDTDYKNLELEMKE